MIRYTVPVLSLPRLPLKDTTCTAIDVRASKTPPKVRAVDDVGSRSIGVRLQMVLPPSCPLTTPVHSAAAAPQSDEISPELSCHACGKEVVNHSELEHHLAQHLASDVGAAEKLSCHLCGKNAANQSELDQHVDQHLSSDSPVGEKFTCQHCGKSVACQLELEHHVNQHLEGKLF